MKLMQQQAVSRLRSQVKIKMSPDQEDLKYSDVTGRKYFENQVSHPSWGRPRATLKGINSNPWISLTKNRTMDPEGLKCRHPENLAFLGEVSALSPLRESGEKGHMPPALPLHRIREKPLTFCRRCWTHTHTQHGSCCPTIWAMNHSQSC